MKYFSKYKNIFGKPKTGLHKHRLLNIAIVDFMITFIMSYIIYKLFFNESGANFFMVLFILLSIGIICHEIFEVRTTVNTYLFH